MRLICSLLFSGHSHADRRVFFVPILVVAVSYAATAQGQQDYLGSQGAAKYSNARDAHEAMWVGKHLVNDFRAIRTQLVPATLQNVVPTDDHAKVDWDEVKKHNALLALQAVLTDGGGNYGFYVKEEDGTTAAEAAQNIETLKLAIDAVKANTTKLAELKLATSRSGVLKAKKYEFDLAWNKRTNGGLNPDLCRAHALGTIPAGETKCLAELVRGSNLTTFYISANHTTGKLTVYLGPYSTGITYPSASTSTPSEMVPFELDVTTTPVTPGAGGHGGRCPHYVGVPIGDNVFLAWLSADYRTIFVHKIGAGLSTAGVNELDKILHVSSKGFFTGYATDGTDHYLMTTELPADGVKSRGFIYKNNENTIVWDAYQSWGEKPGDTVQGMTEPCDFGTSRLALGSTKLFVAMNVAPQHPYQVLLETTGTTTNTRPMRSTGFHHNHETRLLFDGEEFVVMDNRDHDVGITLMKFKPTEKYPFHKHAPPKAYPNYPTTSGNYGERLRSIYSHTNWGNGTFAELGNIRTGYEGSADKAGYLVAFASERDWTNKFKDFPDVEPNRRAPGNAAGARDIALVHVKKDFDETTPNWRYVEGGIDGTKVANGKIVNAGVDLTLQTPSKAGSLVKYGGITQNPWHVDCASVINSEGSGKTVSYQTDRDGWNWSEYPSTDSNRRGIIANWRHITTTGVNWLTTHGEAAETAETIPSGTVTTVRRPKLVRIDKNQYVALWEEWSGSVPGGPSQHSDTKAAVVTLLPGSGDKVKISAPTGGKSIGKIRLHYHDDTFTYNKKAAWITGDTANRELVMHTVDGSGSYQKYRLKPKAN